MAGYMPADHRDEAARLLEASAAAAESALENMAVVFETVGRDRKMTAGEAADAIREAARDWPAALRAAQTSGDVIQRAEEIAHEVTG